MINLIVHPVITGLIIPDLINGVLDMVQVMVPVHGDPAMALGRGLGVLIRGAPAMVVLINVHGAPVHGDLVPEDGNIEVFS
jgi:hypothetical protein